MVESTKEVGQTLGEMKTLEINDWLCKSLVNGAIPPEVIYGYFRVLNFKQDKSFILCFNESLLTISLSRKQILQ